MKDEWHKIDSAPRNETVLIYLGAMSDDLNEWHSKCRIAYFSKDHWQAVNEWIGKDLVTHWQPLPPAPKD